MKIRFPLVTILLSITLLNCKPGGRASANTAKNEISSSDKVKISTINLDTLDFLKNCDTLISHSYIGALQGIKHPKDSTGLFCFIPNYAAPKTYEVVLAYKGIENRNLDKYEEMSKAFNQGCGNNFAKFDCFAFVAPMLDPEKQPDLDSPTMEFPLNVQIYKRESNGRWKPVAGRLVNSFGEYSELRFNTIYGISK
jgi:hypothetical protein